ncbi:MAG: ABC transporter permease [Deltaproteobacteria bacterium]|jgi:NitT/TauT family transport system permease protein|nr:ABC transporter permease [Deltaproteobacteria bacterium]
MTTRQKVVKDKTGFLVRHHNFLVSWASVAVALGLWEVLGRSGLVPPLFLPGFSAVLASGYEMVANGEIFGHLFASLWRIGWGFFLGAGAGIVTGVAVGYFQLADDIARPLVAATYPIPKIAILPLLILWLGIGEGSKVAVIALGVFFPVVINVRAGVRNVDPLLIKAALSLGSGPFNVIRRVILPMTLPMMFAGLKLGVGIALLLVVTAEMIAADKGIGFLILSSADLMQTTRLLFGIMVVSGLGISFAWILDRLEQLLIPWRE